LLLFNADLIIYYGI